jgi:NADPH-dependent stearoyl-CoA 9-desaturase
VSATDTTEHAPADTPAHNAAGTPSAPGRRDGPTDDTALMERTGLTPEQVEAIGEEFDAIRDRILAEIGEEDARYIRGVVRVQRACEAAGRVLLYIPGPVTWLGGVAALATSKVLDNMEIGHNVMHGQYDFMNDPHIHSQHYEWDTAAPSEHWKLSHNFMHHTYTNIIGKDRDVGYGVLRMTEDQAWRPRDKYNPIYGTLLALLFQYGVALHDLEIEKLGGDNAWEEVEDVARVIAIKTAKQEGKDYVLFPLLAGPRAPQVAAGNLVANLIRNVWAFSIIFCGHFPDGTAMFSEEEVEQESRGGWYVRQMIGAANVKGSRLFHIISGNLGHQIEHHLFPDLPSRRYAELSAEVRDVCERYRLPYNVGSFREQFGSVVRKIWRLRKPDGHGGPDEVEGVDLHASDAPLDQARMNGKEIPLAASRAAERKRRERTQHQQERDTHDHGRTDAAVPA